MIPIFIKAITDLSKLIKSIQNNLTFHHLIQFAIKCLSSNLSLYIPPRGTQLLPPSNQKGFKIKQYYSWKLIIILEIKISSTETETNLSPQYWIFLNNKNPFIFWMRERRKFVINTLCLRIQRYYITSLPHQKTNRDYLSYKGMRFFLR